MAEINNSLASQIQVPQIDVLGTLGKATQLQLGQQELQHRQFLYDQGGGYNPSELNTLANTRNTEAETYGRIGNILSNDQSDAAVGLVHDLAKKSNIPAADLYAARLMKMNAGQRKQFGSSLQQYGQSSTPSVEQSGQPAFNRSYGSKTGELSGSLAPAPDNGPPPAPGEAPRPKVPLVQATKAAENQSAVDTHQIEQYTKEQSEAPTMIATLRQMKVDAARVRTGAGADKEQGARKIMVAMGDTFPALKSLSDKFSSPTAAFESLDKNRGIVARAAMKDVDGRAASELEAISSSLASGNTTNKGLDINVSQLIGLKQYQRVRADAAQQYYNTNHTLVGFGTQFNKTAGPAAWIYMSLPPEEQASIRETLKKSDDGKRVLSSLGKQIGFIHQNKLDESLE